MKGPETHWAMVNRTMKDLYEHYTNTYQDIATRVDAITTLVGELEVTRHMLAYHSDPFSLCQALLCRS